MTFAPVRAGTPALGVRVSRTRILGGILAGAFAAFGGAFGVAAQSLAPAPQPVSAPDRPIDGQTIASISGDELARLFREFGLQFDMSADRDGDPAFALHYPQLKVRVTLYRDGETRRYSTLRFLAAFRAATPRQADLDVWNETSTISTAYVDEFGIPVLKTYLDLAGGISPDNLRSYVAAFEVSARYFMERLSPPADEQP